MHMAVMAASAAAAPGNAAGPRATPEALREDAIARREERWLADVAVLLRDSTPAAAPLTGLRLPSIGPSAAVPEVHHAFVEGSEARLEAVGCGRDVWRVTGERERRGPRLEGLGSDCSSIASLTGDGSCSESARSGSGSTVDAAAARGESLRRRLQSVRFLAWQQRQLGLEIERREAAVLAAGQELASLRDECRAQESARQAQDKDLREAEAQLLVEQEQCALSIRESWRVLDDREGALNTEGRDVLEAAERLGQQRACLEEACEVLGVAEQQAAALRRELAFLGDRRQDVEAREATLHCMEGAWGRIVGQGCVAHAGAGSSKASGSDGDYGRAVESALAVVRENVTARVVDALLEGDPRLRRCRGTVQAAVRSSIGYIPATSSRAEGTGLTGQDHGGERNGRHGSLQRLRGRSPRSAVGTEGLEGAEAVVVGAASAGAEGIDAAATHGHAVGAPAAAAGVADAGAAGLDAEATGGSPSGPPCATTPAGLEEKSLQDTEADLDSSASLLPYRSELVGLHSLAAFNPFTMNRGCAGSSSATTPSGRPTRTLIAATRPPEIEGTASAPSSVLVGTRMETATSGTSKLSAGLRPVLLSASSQPLTVRSTATSDGGGPVQRPASMSASWRFAASTGTAPQARTSMTPGVASSPCFGSLLSAPARAGAPALTTPHVSQAAPQMPPRGMGGSMNMAMVSNPHGPMPRAPAAITPSTPALAPIHPLPWGCATPLAPSRLLPVGLGPTAMTLRPLRQ